MTDLENRSRNFDKCVWVDLNFFDSFLFYVYGCFSCIYVCAPWLAWCLRRPEEGAGAPVTGVTGGCQCHAGAGNWTHVLCRSSQCSSYLSSPWQNFLKRGLQLSLTLNTFLSKSWNQNFSLYGLCHLCVPGKISFYCQRYKTMFPVKTKSTYTYYSYKC